jgi:hypothetical protein
MIVQVNKTINTPLGGGAGILPALVGGAVLGQVAKSATAPKAPKAAKQPYPYGGGYPGAAVPPAGTPYCISQSPNDPLICYNQGPPASSQPPAQWDPRPAAPATWSPAPQSPW